MSNHITCIKWLPCQHEQLSSDPCPYCRTSGLAEELETARRAYSDLLINSARELTAAETKLRVLRGCLKSAASDEASNLHSQIKGMLAYLDATP